MRIHSFSVVCHEGGYNWKCIYCGEMYPISTPLPDVNTAANSCQLIELETVLDTIPCRYTRVYKMIKSH